MYVSRNEKQIAAAFFVAFFLLALLFAPSGDDWERISFADRTWNGYGKLVVDQYRELNGRVLGNIFSFLLMVPVGVRALIKAICVTTIGVSLYKISGLKRSAGLLLTLLLITALPLRMHVQVYAWSAGFFNYTIPMAIILAVLAYNEKAKRPMPMGMAAAAGLAACLFVEHVTMILCLIGAVCGVVSLVRKQWNRIWVAFFMGVAAGAMIMFASPAYRTVAEGTDWYRTVPDSAQTLWALIIKNYDRMGPYIFGWEAVTGMIVWLGAAVLLWKNDKKPLCVIWSILSLFFFWFHFPREPRPWFQEALWVSLEITILVHFILTLIHWAILYFGVAPHTRQPHRFRIGLWLWMLGFGPLLFVHPIGPRNYYLGALALMFLALQLVLILGWERWTVIRRVVLTGLIGVFLWRGTMHAQNMVVFLEREHRIEMAMKSKEKQVGLPPFPHIRYMHGDQLESLVYGHYYEKPGDLEFWIIGQPLEKENQ